VYPTLTFFTPLSALNEASGPQNHPEAKTASWQFSGTTKPSPRSVRRASLLAGIAASARTFLLFADAREGAATRAVATAARIGTRVPV